FHRMPSPRSLHTRRERGKTCTRPGTTKPNNRVTLPVPSPIGWERVRVRVLLKNYQTKPCARGASSRFRVQGSTFSENAKRSQSTLPPHFTLGGSNRKLPNEPTIMDRRFQIPDLRGGPGSSAPPRLCASM